MWGRTGVSKGHKFNAPGPGELPMTHGLRGTRDRFLRDGKKDCRSHTEHASPQAKGPDAQFVCKLMV